MTYRKRVAETLQRAEKDLRQIAADALADGRYRIVTELAELAERVVELVPEAPESVVAARSEEGNYAAPEDPESNSQETRLRPKKAAYPQFFRRSDALLKVGWSKKNKSEYEHKASRESVEFVSQKVFDLASTKKLFTSDDLLPGHAPDGSELPTYQIYVALAWLRWAGLLRKHGRHGYSLIGPKKFPEAVDAAWAQLGTK